MEHISGTFDVGEGMFAIVVSRWNELVTKELLEGALDELARYGISNIRIVKVPGSWEIPIAVKKLLTGDERPLGVIALGCILQGQTPHAKLLGGDVAGALMSLQLEFMTPISWGILTPDTQEQALDRAGLKMGNKGREAAGAAIEMASLLEKI